MAARVLFRCDHQDGVTRCSEPYWLGPDNVPEHLVREYAEKVGWFRLDGYDYCPKHAVDHGRGVL